MKKATEDPCFHLVETTSHVGPCGTSTSNVVGFAGWSGTPATPKTGLAVRSELRVGVDNDLERLFGGVEAQAELFGGVEAQAELFAARHREGGARVEEHRLPALGLTGRSRRPAE
ncbi:MAG: hypothetical protein ACRD2W_24945 [Acidimicrobiales bacterium]